MATALDIIERAADRIGVLAGEEVLTSAEASDALTMLNDMLFGFGPMGIQYVHTALALTDTVNFPDEQIRNVAIMFCIDLADDYAITLDNDLKDQIREARLALQAAYLNVNPAVPDRALRVRRPGFYDFARGS